MSKQGNYNQAKNYLNLSLFYCELNEDEGYKVIVLGNIANNFYNAGNISEAILFQKEYITLTSKQPWIDKLLAAQVKLYNGVAKSDNR